MARARKQTKTLRTPAHRALCAVLRQIRQTSGVNQAELARKLHKPQSFVAKYEGGERRLDVVEFLAVANALAVDPVRILRTIIRRLP